MIMNFKKYVPKTLTFNNLFNRIIKSNFFIHRQCTNSIEILSLHERIYNDKKINHVQTDVEQYEKNRIYEIHNFRASD